MIGQFLIAEHNVLGMIGVIMVLLAYFLLQVERLSGASLAYSVLNFVGSILILISLYFTPNVPSVVIEIAWLLISALGLGKILWRYHRG